jgi:hypothetical protein
MKKPSFLLWILHLCLLSTGVGLSVGSLYQPWASGQGSFGLINQTIYAYNAPAFHLPLGLLITLIFIGTIFGVGSLLWPSKNILGIFIILTGLALSALGFYLWYKIDNSDIYLLFKLAEVQPNVGIILIMLGGGVLFIDGLIYSR